MGCYCDFDGPEFLSEDIRTARKKHICCECEHVIVPGEKYEAVSGKWDGRFDSFDTCMPCVDLRQSLADVNGGCFQYGGMSEEYLNYLGNLPLPDGVSSFDIYRRVFENHKERNNGAREEAPELFPGTLESLRDLGIKAESEGE